MENRKWMNVVELVGIDHAGAGRRIESENNFSVKEGQAAPASRIAGQRKRKSRLALE